MIFHRCVCYIAVHLNVKIQIGFWKLVGKIRILKTWKSNHKTLINLRAVYEYLNSFWLLMLSSCQLILKTNRSMIPLSWNYDTVTKKQKHKKQTCCEKFHAEVFSFCSVLLEIEVLTMFQLWVIVGTIFFLLSTWTKGSVLTAQFCCGGGYHEW